MSDTNHPRPPFDRSVPALTMLLGPDSEHLLGSVLAEAGARLSASRATQVRYVPSRSVTVQYRCEVAWPGGSGTSVETMVATTESPIPAEVPVVEVDGSRIGVWRYPHDPFLPGLAAASNEEKVRDVLEQLGAPVEQVGLRRRAYRPGRRAVIEVSSPRARIYVKVVRPKKVAGLQSRHANLVDHVPTPHSYGWSPELGLVAMQSMAGKTLRKRLESGSRQLPPSGQILSLLDRLAEAPMIEKEVAGPIARAGDHAALISAIAPALAPRLEEIIGQVSAVRPTNSDSVHGDFHSSQILVDGRQVVGLIDVDTAGSGDRADDMATLLGHVSTIALMSASRRGIDRYGQELISAFDRLTPAGDLRLRTAAVVLGFATGPFRVQQRRWPQETERRVALAEKWARSATAHGQT